MRHTFLLVALLLATASALADPPVRRGPPSDLVAAPKVAPTPVLFPVWYSPFWGGVYPGFYTPGLYPPPVVVVPQPQPAPVAPVNPARAAEDADRAAATAPATLTLELPAVADLWLDGEKQPSSADTTRTLVSAPLPIGREFTFNIRAQWVENGTTYEAKKTTSIRAGERGKVAVYAGTPVK